MKTVYKQILFFFLVVFLLLTATTRGAKQLQEKANSVVFVRFKINEPVEKKIRVTVGGFRHAGEPWYFQPEISIDARGGEWSSWIDLSKWPWHGQVNRSGGIAEWPAIKLSVTDLGSNKPIDNCSFNVQLNDESSEKTVIVSFAERSASNTIAFLVPYPLRENAKEFETGSQMTARHARWARAAIDGRPIALKKFDVITQIWGHYDPELERQEAQTLRSLGFNVLGSVRPSTLRALGMRTYDTTSLYEADPESVSKQWSAFARNSLADQARSEENRWKYQNMSHWVISDEVSALDLRYVDADRLNSWFRAFLTSKGVTAADIGKSINEVEYPAAAMHERTLPHDAPLETRRLMYYVAKFGHWWSAKQLRQITELIQESFPGMKTQSLLPSHGFLGNAWGPAHVGMSYRMLDIFELGAQKSISQFSAEDWLGLNHMYGPDYTWSGGQTFGYFNAILRSAMRNQPLMLRGLITVSDDEYLRLKAYSSLGQGAKSFFLWTFGPTFIGTENYWSDLRSEYEGIAKLNRALEKAEDVLHPAETVTDPVAILYSVSHDLWNTNNHAAFVEKRLLWHALRHLHVQPNFLREEDVETGKLNDYKVLYLTDWCLSRKSSAAIDEWVKSGGVLYLSAGAATRDEFNEPYLPPFANQVWEDNAAQNLTTEQHTYNERSDLPRIKPLTTVAVNLKGKQFQLPVLGARLNMRPNAKQFAVFNDKTTAGQIIQHGKGFIIGVGFMPMLAYGQLANFKPKTLEEKWTPEPREIVQIALDTAQLAPVVRADIPVVETSFLTGSSGSALVLANYTYQPIKKLNIDITLPKEVKRIVSVEGSKVQIQRLNQASGKIRISLPLKLTDIVLFN